MRRLGKGRKIIQVNLKATKNVKLLLKGKPKIIKRKSLPFRALKADCERQAVAWRRPPGQRG